MEWLNLWAERAAEFIDFGATAFATLASFEALVRAFVAFFTPKQDYRAIRWMLGRRLTLVLELLIASDIIRTAINPSWIDLGQLGAIVVLRELLNYTLNRDIKEATGATPPGQISP